MINKSARHNLYFNCSRTQESPRRIYNNSSLPQRRAVHYQSTGSLHSDSHSSSSVSPIPSPSPRATPLPLQRNPASTINNGTTTSSLTKRWSSIGDFNHSNGNGSPQSKYVVFFFVYASQFDYFLFFRFSNKSFLSLYPKAQTNVPNYRHGYVFYYFFISF